MRGKLIFDLFIWLKDRSIAEFQCTCDNHIHVSNSYANTTHRPQIAHVSIQYLFCNKCVKTIVYVSFFQYFPLVKFKIAPKGPVADLKSIVEWVYIFIDGSRKFREYCGFEIP